MLLVVQESSHMAEFPILSKGDLRHALEACDLEVVGTWNDHLHPGPHRALAHTLKGLFSTHKESAGVLERRAVLDLACNLSPHFPTEAQAQAIEVL